MTKTSKPGANAIINALAKLFTGAALLCASQLGAAGAINDYQFDVIIFENLHAKQQYLADLEAHEFLREQDANEAPPEQDGASFQLDNAVLNYQPLDGGELDKAWKRLNTSSQYRVLARKTWRQSGLTGGGSVIIPLDEETGADPLQSAIQPATGESHVHPYLTGWLSLTFSRYIHLNTDFTLHHSAQQTDVLAPYSEAERISKVRLERKMRSNEVQYIDHPLLGLLVSIKRLPQKQAASAEKVAN